MEHPPTNDQRRTWRMLRVGAWCRAQDSNLHCLAYETSALSIEPARQNAGSRLPGNEGMYLAEVHCRAVGGSRTRTSLRTPPTQGGVSPIAPPRQRAGLPRRDRGVLEEKHGRPPRSRTPIASVSEMRPSVGRAAPARGRIDPPRVERGPALYKNVVQYRYTTGPGKRLKTGRLGGTRTPATQGVNLLLLPLSHEPMTTNGLSPLSRRCRVDRRRIERLTSCMSRRCSAPPSSRS